MSDRRGAPRSVGIERRRAEQGPRAQRGEATPEAEWLATRIKFAL
jgi:hypothetical protein